MSKVSVAMVFASFLMLFLVYTCPNRSQHVNSVAAFTSSKLSERMARQNSLDTIESVSAEFAAKFAEELYGGDLAMAVAAMNVDKVLHFTPYFLFSTASIEKEGRRELVSIGIFNCVFIVSDLGELIELMSAPSKEQAPSDEAERA